MIYQIQYMTETSKCNKEPFQKPLRCLERYDSVKSLRDALDDNSIILFDAVTQAVITFGLTYTSDVFKHVTQAIGATPDDLARSTALLESTENGALGMDIFYCRILVEAIHQKEAALKAVVSKGLKVGQTFKDISLSLTNFSSAVIESIDANGRVRLLCKKRGSRNRWPVNLPATHSVLMPQIKPGG
ncbi:hypothetical protein [Alteromonas gilva]|uniref:Uncharacterized protein n=1 Tax=Alteromonas gilva TaxID=2987522 RepID=A0ABT5L8J6_9ALTE|nr:hypothetical protein [Alteromonas gilva]MDC8832824.1 hypothetical protein [Alteromonas gilva]